MPHAACVLKGRNPLHEMLKQVQGLLPARVVRSQQRQNLRERHRNPAVSPAPRHPAHRFFLHKIDVRENLLFLNPQPLIKALHLAIHFICIVRLPGQAGQSGQEGAAHI